MKSRPVIFSAEEVRATLDGRKGQFRRVVKPQPPMKIGLDGDGRWTPIGIPWAGEDWLCPFGVPGDRLWVRETWALGGDYANGLAAFVPKQERSPDWIRYRSSQEKGLYTGRWRSSSQMPKWASRLTLDVTGVRVERVQEISDEDCRAEGYPGREGSRYNPGKWLDGLKSHGAEYADGCDSRTWFRHFWDSSNAKHPQRVQFSKVMDWKGSNRLGGKLVRGYPWESNPWVFVVEFEVVK